MENQNEIIWLESVDSTNSEVRRCSDTIDNLSVIAAERQSAGRGQRGNSWLSEPGANLTFSFLLRFGTGDLPSIPAGKGFIISQSCAVAVAEFLMQEDIPAAVKWPNDIYVGDRKICGMLIENTLAAGGVSSSIIGIGLNVNQTDFPSGLINPTSMKKVTGKEFNPGPALEKLMGHVRSRVLMMRDATGREAIRRRYMELLYRKDAVYDYTDCSDGSVFRGIIRDVGEDGKIKMEMPDGTSKEFAFKEMNYII